MLTFTSTQLESWLAAYLWPLIRILALVSTAPLLGHRVIPARVKIGLSLAVTIVIAPILPATQVPALLSPAGFITLLQQIFIGVALGFSASIVMAAIELAGETIGLQIGLSYAGFFDLQNQGGNAVASWLTLIASMLFLSIDGHLLMLNTLAESFHWFPLGSTSSLLPDVRGMVMLGARIFSAGLSFAMPVVAIMLFVNLALGIMARTTPQLNIFAIGFPLTLLLGLIALYLTTPYLQAPLTDALLRGLTGTMR